MLSTAFAYAGLTGNGPVDRLVTGDSRRLLAFSRMARPGARDSLHGRGEVCVADGAGLRAAACDCCGLLVDEYGRFINELAVRQ